MDIDFNKSLAENQNDMIAMNSVPAFYATHQSSSYPVLSSVANPYMNPQNTYHFQPHPQASSHTLGAASSRKQKVLHSGQEQLSRGNSNGEQEQEQEHQSMAAMREMIFRIAAMQPVDIDVETVKPPKRRNVKISKDPQSVAARHRREKISERIRVLQKLVPGGTKMDTASMLDEAIHYVKFLQSQVETLENSDTAANELMSSSSSPSSSYGLEYPFSMRLPNLAKE